MSSIADRLKELRGETSQAQMARDLEMPRQQWINYETGKNQPGAEIIIRICRAHACSADWLLGLPTRGGGVGVTATGGSVVAVGAGSRATGGKDCSKCKLMQAHIREITGRK